MPRVSILLPTYNGARYLDEQIGSIAEQDDGDFELLAIDDGSADGTRERLADWARREPRLRVLPSTGNDGQNARLAELLAAARGEFVAISDQDDRWAPDRNRRLLAALDGGAPMALGRSELIDGEGARVGSSLMELSGVVPGAHFRLRALLEPMFSAHATIARRDWLQPAGLTHPLPFDWLQALEALFSGGLVYVDEAVVFHRIHGGNQMNRIALTPASRMTRSHLRWLFMYRRSARIRFWLVLDYLGKSLALDEPTRAIFRSLGQRAYNAWLSEWRSLPAGRRLRDAVATTLRPFAGSEEDWAYFSALIDALTAAPGGRAMRRDVGRRWRLGRAE